MQPRATIESRATLAVVALTLLALALRLSSLGRSLWLDEAWRANMALAPTWQAFWDEVLGSGAGGIGAPQPPLFAVVLRLIGFAVGHSAVGMRLVPLVASVAAVPIAYAAGRRAAGTVAGLAAALCFACAPAALVHGQELKQYSVDIVVVLALVLATAAVAENPSTWRPWIGLMITAALAPGLAYPAALVLPGVALATFVACGSGADRKRWLVAQTASTVAALAWYVLVIGPQRARPRITEYWAGDFPPLEGIPSVGWLGGQLLDFVGYACGRPAWAMAAVVIVGLLLARPWLGLLAIGSVGTLIDAAALRVYPLSGGRTSVFLLCFVYLGLASALAAGVRSELPAALRAIVGTAAAVAIALVVGRGVAAPTSGLVYEETAPLIAAIDAERQPTDRVYVYDGAAQAFRFHHPASDPAITVGGSHRQKPNAYIEEIRPLLTPGQRLWVLFAHVHTPASGKSERDVILTDLGVYAKQLDVRETPGAELYLFEVTRGGDAVKHLKLTPEDLADPERMKKLLNPQ